MNTKNILVGVGLLVVLVLGCTFPRGNSVVKQVVGAAAGPDVSFRTFFYDNIVTGGNVYATSSALSQTYTVNEIVKNRVIEHNVTAVSKTMTLPTGANLLSAGLLPKVGDTYTMFIHGSTTPFTLAGNTGTRLVSASSTAVVLPGVITRLEFVRLNSTTEANLIEVFMLSGAVGQ